MKEPTGIMPVRVSERIEFVDILRGFAILGILVANMAGYSGMSRELNAWPEAVDRAILVLTRFLVEAKFYSLFSFLFGWGMSMQMIRAEARGSRFLPLYLRRLLLLLLFGLGHAILLWSGDVLAIYALFGGLLLLFRKRSPGFLLIACLCCLLFAILITSPIGIMMSFLERFESITAFLRPATYSRNLYGTGTYWEITRLRLQDYAEANSLIIYWAGNLVSMFLLGFYVGKRRIFQEVDQHLFLLRNVLVAGLFIGVLGNGFHVLLNIKPALVPPKYYQMAFRSTRTIGAPALMLFYVSGIILLLRHDLWRHRLAPLASVGRGALSNYLLQSVICTTVCYSYGLGLYGRIDPLLGLIMTIVIYLSQVRLSEWWFSRYRFGPMEWLWRTLTYGQVQPMHLRPVHERQIPSLLLKIRHIVAGVDPTRALVVVWTGLLLWTAGLGIWYVRLEGKSPPASPVPSAANTRPAASPTATHFTTEEAIPLTPQERTLATPAVQSVVYNPGELAAAGDLTALARAFDGESALAQIEILTGPPYLGRYAGSPEAHKAGDYIAAQFARFGLQPAGDEGTFFQSFPVEYVALDREPSVIVEVAGGERYDQYALHRDYSPVVRWYGGTGTAEGPILWVNSCTPDDFSLIEAVGKIVLCQTSTIQEAERQAIEHGAAGLLLLTDPVEHPPDFGNTYFEPWVPQPIPVMRVFPSLVDELLLGSGKTLEDLSISFTPFALRSRVRVDIQTSGPEICPGQECKGRNVLGVLPGRDPALANEVIILGAHYDHIGQAPNGIVWPGANDDASGVAVLLEIARIWQEQGYVPRHTVLFAAWDAEEIGLLGAAHYVEHPRYPLADTTAMIQLDMVGAGSDTLWIDGGVQPGDQLRYVAESLGIDTALTNLGRSDHVPFLTAGVPANLLVWRFDEGQPEYHRPVDTASSITPAKLEAVGQTVVLTILGLTDGQSTIDALLAQRSDAIEREDLDAFLATSLPDIEASERAWFADVQAMAPENVELTATDVRFLSDAATARVQLTFRPPDQKQNVETAPQVTSLAVRFIHDGQGWRWAGPDLTRISTDTAFDIAYPPGKESGLDGLAQVATMQYADMAARLGLPAHRNGMIYLFPDSTSLRSATAPSMPPDIDTWVQSDALMLTYSPAISTSQRLTFGLARLLLAEAGVTEQAAPWLWHGLPQALSQAGDPIEVQSSILPQLDAALNQQDVPETEITGWAAVDYLRQRIGWSGIGRFITSLGQACRDGLCRDASALDRVLANVLQMDAISFKAAWQTHWRDRLEFAQAGLDALLGARADAISRGDEAAFLATVDPDVPEFWAEEQHWFADMLSHQPERFELTGYPSALLPDGSVLARIALDYQLALPASRGVQAKVSLMVLLTPHGDAYKWAGTPFERIQNGNVRVLYPQGQVAHAQSVLEMATILYQELGTDLDVDSSEPLTIKLYDSDEACRTSISLTVPPGTALPVWSDRAEAIKICLPQVADGEDLRPMLVVQMARHLLTQSGVESEWLLKGVSLYLSESYDQGMSIRAATMQLGKLLQTLPKNEFYHLDEVPPDRILEAADRDLLQAQAWDTIRYFTYTYGQDTLLALLRAQAQGQSVDAALRATTGQGQIEFETSWATSLARAHAEPTWIDIANAFDPDRVLAHVETLAGAEMAGRQAGDAGADKAAAYIADQFAAMGLVPIGRLGSNEEVPHSFPNGEPSHFLQSFPITYTTMLAPPSLEITGEQGQKLATFAHRQDFVIPTNTQWSGQTPSGELVWLRDADFQDMNLTDKIIVQQPSDQIKDIAARAAESGVIGIILTGSKANAKEILSKEPLPIVPSTEAAIPVLELTQEGTDHLMALLDETVINNLNQTPALLLGLEASIEIPTSIPHLAETFNVLGLLPGSDPVLRQEIIILGAHYDHVGDDLALEDCAADTTDNRESPATNCESIAGLRYAGANDDASGVGVLIEIARLWHDSGYRPQRSILFAAWGAQEMGEFGSRYYVENAVLPLDKTVAMLQLDTVGGGAGYYLEAQGSREREGLLLFDLVAANEWVDGRLALKKNWHQSDQVPFRDAGIPSLLLTWRDASEDNWPIEIADEVDPFRLGIAGRVTALGIMALAR